MPDKPPTKRELLRKPLLEQLRQAPPRLEGWTTTELWEAVKHRVPCSRSTVERALSDLYREGMDSDDREAARVVCWPYLEAMGTRWWAYYPSYGELCDDYEALRDAQHRLKRLGVAAQASPIDWGSPTRASQFSVSTDRPHLLIHPADLEALLGRLFGSKLGRL